MQKQGKELERQFGWEQAVRTLRQKSQENLIQISSDSLPSVTKDEAPANAIEQKSTEQRSASIQSPGQDWLHLAKTLHLRWVR